MFHDIPDRLTAFVRNAPFQERQILELAAATGVISEYVGLNAFETGKDNFLYPGDHNFPVRIGLVGETLFLLRSCSGFVEICRRLRHRDLRSAYFEMLAAKAFFRAGFDIMARPETGQLGSDFDFMASREGVVVNVEVTALAEKEFHANTMLNALRSKRKQLPRDKPAAIYCVLPQVWEKSVLDLNSWATDLAARFLNGTRRVNLLVLQMEMLLTSTSHATRSGLIMMGKPYLNANPYYSCDLTAVIRSRGDSERIRTAVDIGDETDFQALASEARNSEFYEWIDALRPDVPRKLI